MSFFIARSPNLQIARRAAGYVTYISMRSRRCASARAQAPSSDCTPRC